MAGHVHPIVRPSRVVRQNPESKGADSSHPCPPRRIDTSFPITVPNIPPSGLVGVSLAAADGVVRVLLIGCCYTLRLVGRIRRHWEGRRRSKRDAISPRSLHEKIKERLGYQKPLSRCLEDVIATKLVQRELRGIANARSCWVSNCCGHACRKSRKREIATALW